MWVRIADRALEQRASLRKHSWTVFPPIQRRWHERLCLTHIARLAAAHNRSESPSAETSESAGLALPAIPRPHVSRQRCAKNIFEPRWQVGSANSRVIRRVEVFFPELAR